MYLKIFIRIILVLFFINFNTIKAEEKIVYIDMNKIMTTSLVGKSLNKKLNDYNKKNSSKFQKKLDDIKSRETKLISQKNVLEKKEFEKQYRDIQVDFVSYQKSIDNYNKDFSKKTIKYKGVILNNLTPILSDFAKNNSTSLILNKKNIIIGKVELDITSQVIKILDKKIQDIKLEK